MYHGYFLLSVRNYSPCILTDNIVSWIFLVISSWVLTASNICAYYKQSKSHKLKQTFSNPPKIITTIINIFDNNNRELINVMCISESINIDSYQTNLKAFILQYDTR